ncbi:hypothetical protein Bbelb_380710 [Branchiostoma belcheri]|nr:hypothetical protein Bbelb_380710 [Branchiostoma belcheri]
MPQGELAGCTVISNDVLLNYTTYYLTSGAPLSGIPAALTPAPSLSPKILTCEPWTSQVRVSGNGEHTNKRQADVPQSFLIVSQHHITPPGKTSIKWQRNANMFHLQKEFKLFPQGHTEVKPMPVTTQGSVTIKLRE